MRVLLLLKDIARISSLMCQHSFTIERSWPDVFSFPTTAL